MFLGLFQLLNLSDVLLLILDITTLETVLRLICFLPLWLCWVSWMLLPSIPPQTCSPSLARAGSCPGPSKETRG